jgi:site-specific recombinase XerD
MTINECIRNFLEYIEIEKGRSLKTIDNYARYLNYFEKYLQDKGIKDIKDIKRQDIRDFRMFLNRKKTSGFDKSQDEYIGKKTQNYYLISIRSFLKFLQKNEITAVSPETIDLAKIPERHISFMTDSELSAL